MLSSARFQIGVWTLTAIVVILALFVWWPATKHLNTYSLFPVFGLTAFSLMWTHYIGGALRRYLELPKEVMKSQVAITGYIVLFCILAHPFLLDFQLYLDGLGLPPGSITATYPEAIQQLAILAGVTALTFFLIFELHRFYSDRGWWKYVEWANIAAMSLILLHGFTLGGELRRPWFQVVWIFYGLTLAVAIGYIEYSKRRIHHGRK